MNVVQLFSNAARRNARRATTTEAATNATSAPEAPEAPETIEPKKTAKEKTASPRRRRASAATNKRKTDAAVGNGATPPDAPTNKDDAPKKNDAQQTARSNNAARRATAPATIPPPTAMVAATVATSAPPPNQKTPTSQLRVVVSKHDLVRALGLCEKVAERSGSLPVLSQVLLESGDGCLCLTTTDLSVGLRARISTRAGRPGASAAVEARSLLQLVKKFSGADIEMWAKRDLSVAVRASGRALEFTLPGLAPKDFPALPKPREADLIHVLDPRAMLSLISRTSFAISKDDSRVHLSSALLEFDDERVRMVTTDGHRACKMEVDAGAGAAAGTRMLIPSDGIAALARACKAAEGTATLRILTQGADAFFQLPDLLLNIRLVDAQFPPYEKVIPSGRTHLARTSRAALIEALKSVQIMTNDRTSGALLELSPEALRITGESPDKGTATDSVAVEYDGPKATVGVSVGYLLDAVNAMGTGDVYLSVDSPQDPVVVLPSTTEPEGDCVAVIMPMRL